jgi:hypothetical protein
MEIDEIDDWERIICDLEEGIIDRPIFDSDYFHRTLISLRHAARLMPRLKYMLYELGHTPNFRFEFEPDASSGKAAVQLHCPDLYHPNQSVADAWKCLLADLDADLRMKLIRTTIENWDQHGAKPQSADCAGGARWSGSRAKMRPSEDAQEGRRK